MASVEVVPREKPETGAEEPRSQAEIDTLMRRFFEQNRPDAAGRAPVPERTDAGVERPRRDFDMACGLLERASDAFDLLVNRCQRLERELNETVERARERAAEQDDTIEQWKRLASGFKAQIDASEHTISALKARSDAAEARAAQAEARCSALEKAAGQAALAEQLSTKLHDKVVTAFGIGSRAHPVLEAVATQAAAE
jgi:hypothetical protein